MSIQETFAQWAAEINNEWYGYTAKAGNENVVVFNNQEEAGRIEYNKGRYTVSGDDQDVVESLEHFTNR